MKAPNKYPGTLSHRLSRRGCLAAGLACIASLLLLSGCSESTDSQTQAKPPTTSSTNTPPHELTKIAVGYLPIIPALPLMMAEDSSAFTTAGLEVELVKFTTSNDAMTALIANKIDVYFLASSSVTLLIEQKAPGTIKTFMVNVNSREQPLDHLLVPQNSPVESIKDLVGKTIGVFPGTTMKGFLRAALETSGVAPESVRIVELPPPQQGAALTSGKIDALLALEPVPAQLVGAGRARSIVAGLVESLVLNPWVGGTATVRSDFAAGKRATLDAFRKVIDAQLPLIAHPSDENLAVLSKYTGIPPDVARRAGFVKWAPLGQIPRPDIQRLADKLFEVDALSSRVDTKEIFLE